jgi:O-methyltransferase involved in polyketide biosynthesis
LHPIPNSTDPLINDAFAASLVNAVGIDLFSRLANAAYPAAGRRSRLKPTPNAAQCCTPAADSADKTVPPTHRNENRI